MFQRVFFNILRVKTFSFLSSQICPKSIFFCNHILTLLSEKIHHQFSQISLVHEYTNIFFTYQNHFQKTLNQNMILGSNYSFWEAEHIYALRNCVYLIPNWKKWNILKRTNESGNPKMSSNKKQHCVIHLSLECEKIYIPL